MNPNRAFSSVFLCDGRYLKKTPVRKECVQNQACCFRCRSHMKPDPSSPAGEPAPSEPPFIIITSLHVSGKFSFFFLLFLWQKINRRNKLFLLQKPPSAFLDVTWSADVDQNEPIWLIWSLPVHRGSAWILSSGPDVVVHVPLLCGGQSALCEGGCERSCRGTTC